MTMQSVVVDALPRRATDIRRQRRQQEIRWWLTCAAVLGVATMVAGLGYLRIAQVYLGFSVAVLFTVLALWWTAPKVALGTTIVLTLVGDLVTVSWFPFNKNLSSRESIMYLADGLIVSPLEITLVWAVVATCMRNVATIKRLLVAAPLIRPFGLFLLFIVGGMATGIGTGGDIRIALIEVRPLLYLPLFYVLFTNICETRSDYRRMLGVVLTAVFVQALLSLQFLDRLSIEDRDGLESLNEHGAAIGMNLFFVTTIGALAFVRVRPGMRFLLLFAIAPVLYVYFVSQRRAAVVTLGAALILLAIVLFWRQRRTFWKAIPIATLIVVGYTGAFWNSESSAAFPAQAIKSVVAPDSLGTKDQSSDLYREIERFDLSFTIRDAPITGQGFGQKFLRPIPLPDISSFEFYEYLPHNSLLWVWIKTGFFGFATLFYLLARTISLGAARLRASPAGIDSVVALALVSFAVMFSIYLYVEIAWEPRNVLLLALAMSFCTGPLRDPDPKRQPGSATQRHLTTV